MLNTSNFAVGVYDGHTDMLDFLLILDQGEQKGPCSVKISENQGLVSHALAARDALLICDLAKAGILVQTDPICPDEVVRSWLSVPIYKPGTINGRARGLMAVWSDEPNAFTDRESQLLSALAARADLVIRNARLLDVEQANGRQGPLIGRGQAVEAKERIRKELARDLHDGPIQLLSALMMGLDFCRQAIERDPTLMPEQIADMQQLAGRALRQMRTMLFELRPVVLETQGLSAALQVFLEHHRKLARSTQLKLTLETCQPDGELSRLQAKVEAALFSIVCEAVNNALKHAGANHIAVRLKETPANMCIEILDDGRGYDVDEARLRAERQGSLGLVNIRERVELIGGELKIASAPGQGTRIVVTRPK